MSAAALPKNADRFCLKTSRRNATIYVAWGLSRDITKELNHDESTIKSSRRVVRCVWSGAVRFGGENIHVDGRRKRNRFGRLCKDIRRRRRVQWQAAAHRLLDCRRRVHRNVEQSSCIGEYRRQSQRTAFRSLYLPDVGWRALRRHHDEVHPRAACAAG